MSQLSQLSQISGLSGISDIIPDVDGFVAEHGIAEDVKLFWEDRKNNKAEAPEADPEEDTKPNLREIDEIGNYPNYNHTPRKFPPSQPSNFCNENYPGPFDFKVLINQGPKASWEYSQALNKVFIDMGQKIPYDFSLSKRPNFNLFIRATLTFSQAQFFQEMAYTCLQHKHYTCPTNIGLPPHVISHIMRCSNIDAKYVGDKNKHERLSIVFPLIQPHVGQRNVTEYFYFVCKNSCSTGIARKYTQIVFSLENDNGEVFGRQIVGLKICAVAKRDRMKEENELKNGNVPKVNVASAPKPKKRKLNQDSNSGIIRTTVGTPTGPRNYKRLILQYSLALMSMEIVAAQNSNLPHDRFKKCYQEISEEIERTD